MSRLKEATLKIIKMFGCCIEKKSVYHKPESFVRHLKSKVDSSQVNFLLQVCFTEPGMKTYGIMMR